MNQGISALQEMICIYRRIKSLVLCYATIRYLGQVSFINFLLISMFNLTCWAEVAKVAVIVVDEYCINYVITYIQVWKSPVQLSSHY